MNIANDGSTAPSLSLSHKRWELIPAKLEHLILKIHHRRHDRRSVFFYFSINSLIFLIVSLTVFKPCRLSANRKPIGSAYRARQSMLLT